MYPYEKHLPQDTGRCSDPSTDPPDDNSDWICDHECDLEMCMLGGTADFVGDCPEFQRIMAKYE